MDNAFDKMLQKFKAIDIKNQYQYKGNVDISRGDHSSFFSEDKTYFNNSVESLLSQHLYHFKQCIDGFEDNRIIDYIEGLGLEKPRPTPTAIIAVGQTQDDLIELELAKISFEANMQYYKFVLGYRDMLISRTRTETYIEPTAAELKTYTIEKFINAYLLDCSLKGVEPLLNNQKRDLEGMAVERPFYKQRFKSGNSFYKAYQKRNNFKPEQLKDKAYLCKLSNNPTLVEEYFNKKD